MMLTSEELHRLRQRLAEELRAPVKARAIRAIRVNSAQHWQPPLIIEVGRICRHLEKGAPPEKVMAILESTTFMVCTSGRGLLEGSSPYFFAREDVRQVVEY
jgi:hypothetical protein